MAWRNAYSLDTLISQLNTDYPGWLFLGTKGDAAHQAVASDHNPNAQGVVTALDIGSGGGLKIHELADRLAANPHPDLKYIISNRRIAEWQYGFKWRAYNGSDPHDTHIHVSVGRGVDGKSVQPYDDKTNWDVKGDEMFEGRTAAEWAAQAKDAEQYKQAVVKSISWKKGVNAYGGGMDEKIGNIRPVIDSLEQFKHDSQSKYEQITEPLFKKIK